MLLTILLLIFTILVVPYISFNYGTPLTELQKMILWDSSYILLGATAYCFIVSELTRNNSQVDKLWSIIPIVYAWYITASGGWNERMVLMAILVTIWGARLTFNFARRGGYSLKFWEGEEDYRWEVLRQRPGLNNKAIWFFFNLFFICAYQMTLIFLFTLPILTGLSENAPDLFWADYLLAALLIGFVIIETIADQQQWIFQTEKYRRINAQEDLGEYAHGFVRTGLWGLVRHPNYMAEQAVWIVFYCFSIVATGEFINWSIAGVLLLIILFKSSSDFSEALTAQKYPEYKNYQNKVPRFLPFTKW